MKIESDKAQKIRGKKRNEEREKKASECKGVCRK